MLASVQPIGMSKNLISGIDGFYANVQKNIYTEWQREMPGRMTRDTLSWWARSLIAIYHMCIFANFSNNGEHLLRFCVPQSCMEGF